MVVICAVIASLEFGEQYMIIVLHCTDSWSRRMAPVSLLLVSWQPHVGSIEESFGGLCVSKWCSVEFRNTCSARISQKPVPVMPALSDFECIIPKFDYRSPICRCSHLQELSLDSEMTSTLALSHFGCQLLSQFFPWTFSRLRQACRMVSIPGKLGWCSCIRKSPW